MEPILPCLKDHVPPAELLKISGEIEKLMKLFRSKEEFYGREIKIRGIPVPQDIGLKLGSITSSDASPTSYVHPVKSSTLPRRPRGISYQQFSEDPWTTINSSGWLDRFKSQPKDGYRFEFEGMDLIGLEEQGAKEFLSRYTVNHGKNSILKEAKLGSEKLWLITGFIKVSGLVITAHSGVKIQPNAPTLRVHNDMVIMVQLQEIYFKPFRDERRAYLHEGKRMKRFWRAVGMFEQATILEDVKHEP